jgi:hypothetical protein
MKMKKKTAKAYDVMDMGDGVSLKVFGMPVLAPASIRTAYNAENPMPKVPTYTSTGFGDVEVVFEHDATTVTTPEEKAEWNAYIQNLEKWKNGLAEKMIMFFLAECTELQVENTAVFDEWDERLEYLGVKPKTKMTKKLAYLQHFVITDSETLATVSERISELTGIKKADLEAAENMFPHKV